MKCRSGFSKQIIGFPVKVALIRFNASRFSTVVKFSLNFIKLFEQNNLVSINTVEQFF